MPLAYFIDEKKTMPWAVTVGWLGGGHDERERP